jgi:threonine synthase
LARVRATVSPADLGRRPLSLWRYRELLPLPMELEPISLDEGCTPLLPCPRLAKELGLRQLRIKDESRLPTGSFKARGMTVAVSMARHLGVRQVAISTAGNAGGALAAYGARAGLDVFVFMPEDTPRINQVEAYLAGAEVFLVNGLITDCGRLVRMGAERLGWFDMSTLKEPYRLEGKKTMGLELAEQLGWRLPDVILYPTGGGTGLIGMWKAFAELQSLGWLKSHHLPRMVCCQSDGCAPIVNAFASGKRFAEAIASPATRASGLRVPSAVGDFMILDAVRASNGCAVTGREGSIADWIRKVATLEGIGICPETAICFDALRHLVAMGKVGADEHVVVFNTAAAQKYPEVVELSLPLVDKDHPPAFDSLVVRSQKR